MEEKVKKKRVRSRKGSVPNPQPELYLSEPEEALRVAKLAFFERYGLEAICEAYGIPPATLNYQCYYAAEPWRKERETRDKDLVDDLYKGKKECATHILGSTLYLIKEGLIKLVKDSKPLGVEALQKLGSLATDMNKIVKLDLGEATDILEQRKYDLTAKGMRDLVSDIQAIDPYSDYSIDTKDKLN